MQHPKKKKHPEFAFEKNQKALSVKEEGSHLKLLLPESSRKMGNEFENPYISRHIIYISAKEFTRFLSDCIF